MWQWRRNADGSNNREGLLMQHAMKTDGAKFVMVQRNDSWCGDSGEDCCAATTGLEARRKPAI